MKILSYIPLFMILTLLAGCDTTGPKEKPDEPDEPKELFPAPINEDISLLRWCCDNPFNEGPPTFGTGSYYLSEWTPGKIYTIVELRRLDLQDNVGFFSISGEEYYEADPVDGDGRPLTFITKSPVKSLLHFVVTNEPGKSIGELRAFNLETRKTAQLLRDSTCF